MAARMALGRSGSDHHLQSWKDQLAYASSQTSWWQALFLLFGLMTSTTRYGCDRTAIRLYCLATNQDDHSLNHREEIASLPEDADAACPYSKLPHHSPPAKVWLRLQGCANHSNLLLKC